jgi:hypothetical protein
MTPVWLLTLSIGLVSLTSLGLLIIRDWRWSILTLSIQYIGVVLMVMPAWPLELAIPRETQTSLSGQIFRLIAAGLVALVLFSIVPRSTDWFVQVNIASRWGGFILIGMGLLHLGLTNHPLRVTLGLLTVFSGFEILYASVESSTLVAGLIAGITLGLALVCAYLLIAPTIEEGE